MTVLNADDIILPVVAMFGPCVVSVGYYTREVRPDKHVGKMSDKERRKAAEWVHKWLVKWGFDGGRTVEQVRDQYFHKG